MIELPKMLVNQNDANHVSIVIGMLKLNSAFNDKIDAIGPPITKATTIAKMIIYCMINPIKF